MTTGYGELMPGGGASGQDAREQPWQPTRAAARSGESGPHRPGRPQLRPRPSTVLQAGDRLLIVATAAVREQTERWLRAVGRAGKLAGWFGERGR